MRSRLSIAGHPLHPSLVVLPIGLFVWAFVADLVYLGTDRNQTWYDISFWSGIAAIATATLAALAGVVDYVTIVPKSEARTLATGHMALNVIVLILFVLAAFLMADRAALAGTRLAGVVALHGAGVLLLAVSGYLGGEMVYKHHLAVVPHDAADARAEEAYHRARPTSGKMPRLAEPVPELDGQPRA